MRVWTNKFLACQVLDWKTHKILCKPANDPKPGDDYRRALFFPGGDEKPRLEWIKIIIDGLPGSQYETFNKEQYLGTSSPETYHSTRNNIQVRNTNRDDTESLTIYCSTHPATLPLNRGLRRFTRAGVAGTHLWRGPVLVMRSGSALTRHEYRRDIGMRDARNIADYFSYAYRGIGNRKCFQFASKILHERLLPRSRSDTSDIYSEIILNGDDMIFSQQGSAIANLLGIPLQMRGVARSRDHEFKVNGRKVEGSLRVLEAELLKIDIISLTVGPQMTPPEVECRDALYLANPNGAAGLLYQHRVDTGVEGFGSVTDGWPRDDMGGVLVARADGHPLPRHHLEVFVEYVKQKVQPMIAAAINGLQPGATVLGREEILNAITPEAFNDFYHIYAMEKALRDLSWASLPSPHDVKALDKDTVQKETRAMLAEQEAMGIRQLSEVTPPPAGGMWINYPQ